MNTKTCSICKEVKSISGFSNRTASKDGFETRCRGCIKDYDTRRKSSQESKSHKKVYDLNLRADMTLVERTSVGSVNGARSRSDLSSHSLFGGLSYQEAVLMTSPFVQERLRLEATTGIAHHIDHIISIKEGGTHTADNLQVLTAADNMAKG